MITIHHLNMSRSERIVWLAEELAINYELVHHQRDPKTFRSPQSIFELSPLGKSPVVQDGDRVICESGAVVEYLIERHGQGRLKPAVDSDAYVAYLHWMHAAESTLMVPILFDLYGKLLQIQSAAYDGFMQAEFATTLSHLDRTLGVSPYVAGEAFTGADVMVAYDLHLANGTSFPALKTAAPIEQYPNIVAYLARVEARPAYQRMRQLCP